LYAANCYRIRLTQPYRNHLVAISLHEHLGRADGTITNEEIFHYIYALLHHAGYRERYAANLKLELPRIPFAPDFEAFTAAGKELARVHVEYE
jgi:predicted helicase